MEKLKDIKQRIYLYCRSLSRERIAVFICIPLALVALSVCAVILLTMNNEKSAPVSKTETETANNTCTELQTYAPNNPYGIEFKKIGEGVCSVIGIGDFKEKDLKIPQKSPSGDVVVKINANAFNGCNKLETITIPGTVTEIDSKAFIDCSSLMYIDVDIESDSFRSIGGVLFSKSRTRLICYPQSKAGDKYYLNPNVKQIDAYAFHAPKNLSAILYPESASSFEAIQIGNGNEALKRLPVTCNYVNGK